MLGLAQPSRRLLRLVTAAPLRLGRQTTNDDGFANDAEAAVGIAETTTGTKKFSNKTGETLEPEEARGKAPPIVAVKPRTIPPKAKRSDGGLTG